MRKSDYRGAKCVKRKLSKCEGVCRTYGDLQYAFADVLELAEDVVSFKVNVLLEGIELEGKYTSDFVIKKADGNLMIRECVERTKIHTPKNCELLDACKAFWENRGVYDFGIVTNKAD